MTVNQFCSVASSHLSVCGTFNRVMIVMPSHTSGLVHVHNDKQFLSNFLKPKIINFYGSFLKLFILYIFYIYIFFLNIFIYFFYIIIYIYIIYFFYYIFFYIIYFDLKVEIFVHV